MGNFPLEAVVKEGGEEKRKKRIKKCTRLWSKIACSLGGVGKEGEGESKNAPT